MTPLDTLGDLLVPVDELDFYPGNARTHDDAALRESLTANGQYRPLVASSRTRQVLAGNGTLAAARELGWTHVAVTWVDVDDEAARRIVLVDNRANDLAGYDEALLLDLLAQAPDLTGTGYDPAYLEALLARVVPEPPTPPDGFQSYDDDIATEHQCPKCGYEWSGKPGGGGGEE